MTGGVRRQEQAPALRIAVYFFSSVLPVSQRRADTISAPTAYQAFFSRARNEHTKAFFSVSAKNALLTQTSEVWRDRSPSIFNPQGELCPPEERFSRRGARRPVANNRFLSDFAPENFRRNFSKIRKPKNSVGMKFPRSFCPFQRNRKIYLKRIAHCTRVRATRAPS